MSIFLNFHSGKTFLLVDYLILHTVLLFNLKVIELFLLVVLLFDYLCLFALLAARLEDRLLHLSLLILSLSVEVVVVASLHALVLVLHLVVINFLKYIKAHKVRQIRLENEQPIWLVLPSEYDLRFSSSESGSHSCASSYRRFSSMFFALPA